MSSREALVLVEASERTWTRRRFKFLTEIYNSNESEQQYVTFPVAEHKTIILKLHIKNYDKYPDILDLLRNYCTVSIDESSKTLVASCPLKLISHDIEKCVTGAIEYRGFINYEPEKLRKLLPLLLLLHLGTALQEHRERSYTIVEYVNEKATSTMLCTSFSPTSTHIHPATQLENILKTFAEARTSPASPEAIQLLEEKFREIEKYVKNIVESFPELVKFIEEQYGVKIENVNELLSVLKEKIEVLKSRLGTQS